MSDTVLVVIGAAVVVLVVLLVVLAFKYWNQSTALRLQLGRYEGIVDVDAAIAAANQQLHEAKQRTEQIAEQDKKRRQDLETQYKHARGRYEELQHEIALLEENLDDISFGLYKPHFSFDTSEEYKDALVGIRNQMKKLIREGGPRYVRTIGP